MKELVVLLSETVEAYPRVIGSLNPRHGPLAPFIFRGAVLRCSTREIIWIAYVVGAVVMEEWRNRQHQPRAERAHPRKGGKGIVFPVGIAQRHAGTIERIVRVKRHLVIVPARLRNEAQLIL